uniref:Putative plant transposon protein domain-containing protein n=1 Tax=Solanum tuberosum TaxID=4113 RepID=M1DDW5_SOLTU
MTTPKIDTPSRFEEGGSKNDNGEDSKSQYDTAAGSQSVDNSRGSAESESSSQEDPNTSPSAVNIEVGTGVREEEATIEDDEEITDDDAMDVAWPRILCTGLVGFFEAKHHEVTSDITMKINSSRETVLRWIAKQISIDGENVVWVTTMPTLIPKALLSFPAKVWWVVVHAQLRPIGTDNTLSPSLASLVTCLMAGYPVNVGRIITTEMRNRALNEKVGFPFPCLIGKLCRQADIPPNKLIDRWRDAFRLIQVSKIKDVANHLFGTKYADVGNEYKKERRKEGGEEKVNKAVPPQAP